LGVPASIASWDLSKKGFRYNPRILKTRSIENLRRAIDSLGHHNTKSIRAPQPELKVRGYRGHDIYYYESRYFAVAPGQARFDIELLRSKSAGEISVGHTIRDVKEDIDRREQQSHSSNTLRVLFVCHTPLRHVEKEFAAFEHHDLTVLCVANCNVPNGPYKILLYTDAEGRNSDQINIQSVSPELLKYLREQQFDLVVVPYEGRGFWEGIHVEQFTSAFANCIVNVFPGGRSRMYRGEDVHRIQYNKAYLNSMFRHVSSIRGKKVLEVGCADGLACDLLLCEEPDEITGIDVIDIAGCAYRDPRIRYERLDGAVLPFENNSFDLSYSIATLEHCVDPFKVIQEMKRVTKPGGYCYIQAGPLYFSPFGHHMFGYFDDKPWVHLRLSPDEMIEDLKEKGLGEKIKNDFGKDVESYVHSMINIDHINGLRIDEYRLVHFKSFSDIEMISSSRSYEGENLLSDDIRRELGYLSRRDLVAHGFELIFRKKR